MDESKKQKPDKTNWPKVGKQYQHFRGSRCEVITCGLDDDGKEWVAYRDIDFGTVHFKLLSDWLRPMPVVGSEINIVRYKIIEM